MKQLLRNYPLLLLIFLMMFTLSRCYHEVRIVKSRENTVAVTALPPEMLDAVLEFKKEAETRGIFVNPETIRYEIIHDPYYFLFSFMGVCVTHGDTGQRVLKLVHVPNKSRMKRTLHHELGHCLLNYQHLYEFRNRTQLMYFLDDASGEISKEEWDSFFFDSPSVRGDYGDEVSGMFSYAFFSSLEWIKSFF